MRDIEIITNPKGFVAIYDPHPLCHGYINTHKHWFVLMQALLHAQKRHNKGKKSICSYWIWHLHFWNDWPNIDKAFIVIIFLLFLHMQYFIYRNAESAFASSVRNKQRHHFSCNRKQCIFQAKLVAWSKHNYVSRGSQGPEKCETDRRKLSFLRILWRILGLKK